MSILVKSNGQQEIMRQCMCSIYPHMLLIFSNNMPHFFRSLPKCRLQRAFPSLCPLSSLHCSPPHQLPSNILLFYLFTLKLSVLSQYNISSMKKRSLPLFTYPSQPLTSAQHLVSSSCLLSAEGTKKSCCCCFCCFF